MYKRQQLNEDSLWYGGPMDRINPEAGKHMREVQELILEDRISAVSYTHLDVYKRQAQGNGSAFRSGKREAGEKSAGTDPETGSGKQ